MAGRPRLYDEYLDGNEHRIGGSKGALRMFQQHIHSAARYRQLRVEAVMFDGQLIVKAKIRNDNFVNMQKASDNPE